MLIIRLQRTGKRNRPDFRVILAEKTAASQKKFQEVLGSYNPRTKELVVKDGERLQYWIGQHVVLSPTVHNLFVTKAILTAPKVKSFSVPKKEVKAEEAAPQTPASEAAPLESTEAPAQAEEHTPVVEAVPEESKSTEEATV